MLQQTNQVRLILAAILALFLLLILVATPFSETEQADVSTDQEVVQTEDGEVEVESDDGAIPAEVLEIPTRSLDGVPILSDDALAADSNPVMRIGQRPEHNIITYTVARGDTPNVIAERFGIQSTTILGGNPNLSEESNLLGAGAELRILPIDGVLHQVNYGETIESIAAEYDVPVEDIINYAPNRLEFPYRVYKGTEIMVPGAVAQVFTWTPPKNNRPRSTVVGTGTFVQPVRRGCVTQYFYPWHRGLDVGLPVGTPVYSMDRGTVIYGSWAAGSYYDYGNLIVVDHGNGYETYYAHLNGINVFPGQVVDQGQFIGYSGNTGRSSGPHIHVEIRFNNNQDDPSFLIQGTYSGCEISR